MASAYCQNPFRINYHFRENSRLLAPKIEYSSVNFPSNVDLSRLIFYQTLASTSTSKEYAGDVHCLSNDDGSMNEKVPTPMLDMIENPMHLKNLTSKELRQLANDIQSELMFIMSQTQRSVKDSLSVVELTVAIHHVFHSPLDKILWDMEDRTYPHKLLTGRRPLVHKARTPDDLSSYTCRDAFDPFGAGHGCSSISAGLGMAVARDIKGKRERIVAVIGNETTTAGQVYEAMSNAGYLDSNMVIILNDSHHSLHPKLEQVPKASINVLSSTLSKLQSSNFFRKFGEFAKVLNPVLPSESSIDIDSLLCNSRPQTYSDHFVEALITESEKDEDIVVVHAGMGMEPSFQLLRDKLQNKFFHVGMAEQHAVTFSAGLSCGGLKPFCIIPSAFLQRAYDQDGDSHSPSSSC